MVKLYTDANYQLLLDQANRHGTYGAAGALPRRTRYGSSEAAQHFLVPYGDVVSDLPDQKDWKELIQEANEKKLFPIYHRQASTVLEQQPSQNGLNYCWTWSLRAATENARRLYGLPDVSLAPTSLAWLVNYSNAGYYLDAAIKGACERGFAPMSMLPNQYSRSPSSWQSGWEQEALKYRPLEWWDGDTSQGTIFVIKQALAILRTGTPLYVALNWWSHALCIFGLTWDESQPNGIIWDYFNSHADGHIQLVGSRGVPDEFYGVRDVNREALAV